MRDRPAWRRWVAARLAGAPFGEAARARVVEELAEMLEECERASRARGRPPQEARAEAEGEVEDWAALIAQIAAAERDDFRARTRADRVRRRRERAGSLIAGLGRDLRTAARGLRRSPVFTAVVVLTLALGLGANVAIFGLVDGVLLAPLPYPHPERLVRLYSAHPAEGVEATGVSKGDLVEWRRRSTQLEGLAGWYVMGRTLVIEGGVVDAGVTGAEIVSVAQVSEEFFGVLGVEPELGRVFTPEETARSTFNSAAGPTGADPVVVLSHRAWRQRFGADPNVVGSRLTLDRRRWRVVGVMPASFAYPDPGVELWIPWSFEGSRPHDQRYLSALGRLAKSSSLGSAQAELDALSAALGDELPESNRGWRVRLSPLSDDLLGSTRPTLLVLVGAVGSLLLVVCLNVSFLQLVRVGERRREVAVRFALGAPASRVAGALLIENLLLAALGGAAALGTAFGVLGAAEVLVPGGLPRWEGPRLGSRTLAFAAVATVSTGVLFALPPLWAAVGRSSTRLTGAGRGAIGDSPLGRTWRRRLVVGELAVAFALVVAAGLFLRTLIELRATDVGFRPERVVVLPIALDSVEYGSGEKTRTYYRTLLAELAAVPGVESVGAATALPMSPIGPDFDRPVWAEGEAPPIGGAQRADVRMATPGYFETLGIPLLAGRSLGAADDEDSRRVVVVSESLARRTWPGKEPIGERLMIDYGPAGTDPYEVVGMVGDVRFRGVRSAPRPELYLPHAQRPYLIMNVAVRTATPPPGLTVRLRRTVLEVDPLQPAYRVDSLEELLGSSLARDRLVVALVGCFGVLALVLALTGIFGVLSHDAIGRRRELGVRAALGASRRQLVRQVLVPGVRLTVSGTALGVLAALATSRLLEQVLYGVRALDLGTYLLVAALVMSVSMLASYLPARRAAGVDPVVALRSDAE